MERHARGRLRRWFRPDPGREIDDELAFHLDMRAADLEARGVAPGEAREQARARLGDVVATRAECLGIAERRRRRMDRREWLDDLGQDLRFGLRALARRPGFAAVAVLTLALGIGANSAVYSVIDAVLLRPLPFPEPERLARVDHLNTEEGKWGVAEGRFSPQDFADLAAAATSFQSLAAFFHEAGESGVGLLAGDEPSYVEAAYVSGTFFSTLGRAAASGRTLLPRDDVPGQDRVAVLSWSFWESHFGADPAAVGRTVTLEGQPFTIVGVMPSALDFPTRDVGIWLPLSLIGEDDIPSFRALRWLQVVGRLAPGVPLVAARAELEGLLAGLAASYPESNRGWTQARVVPLHESLVGDVEPALAAVAAAVALVLLIACGNLANLLLARGSGRRRELALRTALGAERGRLLRQLLSESMVLALLGGAVGLLLAVALLESAEGLLVARLPRLAAIDLDPRVIAFALVASLLSTLLFGLLPAARLSRPEDAAALREGGRGATESRSPLRAALVVTQTAMAAVLLIAAGLLVRSLWELTHVDPGFRAERVLTVDLRYPDGSSEDPEFMARRARLLERLRAVPGVTAVGAAKTLPLRGGGEPFALALPERPEDLLRPTGGGFIVSPGYFEALEIPVLAGRDFRPQDAGGPVGVIVSRSLARQLWPRQAAVGRTVEIFGNEATVLGVVGDVRIEGLASEPEPAVYVPWFLAPRSRLRVFVRTDGDPAAFAAAVHAAVREIDPELPVIATVPLTDLVAETVERPRLLVLLLTVLAALALGLSLVGLYGVISFLVAQRTREFGVRLALGAQRRELMAMVLGGTARLSALGVALGLLAALLLGRLLAAHLFGVPAADPATFVGVALLLGLGALAAGWIPARSAARVEPVDSLRNE